ncbi:MAG TPA: response regulator transcription factor [Gammaproteobacteria bacterium]|nr:response regulator transcription factor [Gammaproteobacteria bacterium]
MTQDGARIRALLVDDHPVVRAGYKLLLEQGDEIEVVAEAESGEVACRHYIDRAPDVVIMDLSLRGMSGLEAIRRIVSRDEHAKILVFSMHEDTMFVERALAAGAKGYLTKSSAPDALVDAAKQVAAGKLYLDADIARRLAFQKAGGRSATLQALSTREFEIFCLLASGETSADIGRQLSLSAKTVANYASQIKSKLGTSTTAELTRLAIRQGIIEA